MTDVRPLRLGIVGGGVDAFIGAVHRRAAALDGHFVFMAGALSSTPERARWSGHLLGLADDRSYATWKDMLAAELRRDAPDRIQAVSIVTPNDSHAEICEAFLGARIPVMVEKPMTRTLVEAVRLRDAVQRTSTPLFVSYTYAGYPMVREAQRLVSTGALGDLRRVVVDYHQGWLSDPIERQGQKQASWRTDPSRAGAGALGDIGSHAEQLIRFITGLHPVEIAAEVRTVVAGRHVDDDLSVMVRLGEADSSSGHTLGLISVSQVATGSGNDLRIRIWGHRAGLEWHQQNPEVLRYLDADGTQRDLRRGSGSTDDRVRASSRLPGGHPEGYIEAFANLYADFAHSIRAGAALSPGFDVHSGARTMAFIDAAQRSSQANAAWVRLASTAP